MSMEPAHSTTLSPLPASERRHNEPESENGVVKIISGDCYVTTKDEMLVTILGSCVSACIRDPIMKVGGMNHFLLPDGFDNEESTRYGAYAMEKLINDILKRGGLKTRLEIKIFGGGNVTQSTAMIGDKNALFVRQFLKREGLPVAGEDLGGTYPRRIHYYPFTGKVMMRPLRRKEDMAVMDTEQRYAKSLVIKPVEGEIDLF